MKHRGNSSYLGFSSNTLFWAVWWLFFFCWNGKGLFRIPANSEELNEVKERIRRGEYIEWKSEFEEKVDLVASLLKLFIRELEEPLFPFHLYSKLVSLKEEREEKKQKERLKCLLPLLPPLHLSFLSHLFHFLLQVSKFSHFNLMPPSNLGYLLSSLFFSLLFSLFFSSSFFSFLFYLLLTFFCSQRNCVCTFTDSSKGGNFRDNDEHEYCQHSHPLPPL